MDNSKVFYSWEHLSCINYTGNLEGGFKLIQLEKGFTHTFEKGKLDYFLFFVLEGWIDMFCNDFYRWEVKEGEMFLLTEGYTIKCQTPVHLIFFTSDHPGNNGSKVLRRLSSVCEKLEYTYAVMEIRKPLMLFLNLLKHYLSDRVMCGHLQEEKQEELFALLETCYSTIELAELFYPIMMNKDREFTRLVLSHCLQSHSVAELITLCGYNEGCFKKTFKEVFDKPIYQWIQTQKAEHIKYRLTDININFKELMGELGFDSASHFNKFCQKWLGMSPSRYIEMIQKEQDEKSVLDLQ